ncbi:auxin-responsive protein IAA10-like isoform X1 [Carex littledalei]|uniref:Auxin-responsive protein n=1 Tax=Carex littledalei TaxID=544730 RepID=A0A833QII6_9POAL|nr:auxin-responsive protein IAA10-like isoform X1 [Carex littledalei]
MDEVEETHEMREVEQNQAAAEKEEEEELELGLSLGAKKFTTCNTTASKSTCRILTAKDFRPVTGGPTSSASSSSSAVGSGGTKRAKPGPTSPEGAVGSSQPPSSQMVVGWPPVRTFRMNSLFNLSKDTTDQNSTKISNTSAGLNGEKNKEKKKLGSGTVSSPYVKVKMDGDPIGRKIDLSCLNSYKALASVLELMFQKPGLGSCTITKLKLLEDSSEYKLTYQDKEGDWMLVGDVPWRMFLDTVKRLRIMRHCDDHALTPKFCSSNLSKKLLC